MTICYDNNMEDINAFILHYLNHSPHCLRIRRIMSILAPAIWFLALMVGASKHLLVSLVVWILISLAWVWWFPRYQFWHAKRTTAKLMKEGQNAGFLCEHRIEITPEYMIETTDVGETKVFWRGVEKIAEDSGYLYFYTGAMQAHVIPRRAFASRAEAQEFRETARHYREQAAGLEPAIEIPSLKG
jgi:hypothetical protein